MDGDAGVLDVEIGAGGEDGGAGGHEGGGEGEGQGDQDGQQRQLTPEQQQAKANRDYANWLKSLRKADPKAHGNFARLSKENHARLVALSQLEPKGVDGVREKYAVLDSVSYDDPERGELRGAEAVAALQDQVRAYADSDQMLAAGNPRVFDGLGEEFNEGLAKLAPAFLDRVREANPEAYAAAILPHFVQALAQSDLMTGYNAMVDVLNEPMPQWLPEDKKAAWVADKFRRLTEHASGMGTWMKAQFDAAGKAGNREQGTGNRRQGAGAGEDDKAAREQAAQRETEQRRHYETNITPKLNQYAEQTFTKLFAPYGKRLRLDNAARQDLAQSFTKGVMAKAMERQNGRMGTYESQMARYWKQDRVNPQSVLNFAQVEFDKHAAQVLKSLVTQRYGRFLSAPGNGNGQATGNRQQATGNGQVKRAPVAPGVTIVSVKPSSADIDFKNTPLDWMHAAADGSRKYRLTNGKVVLWRPQR
jgi:hypothetical protein